MLYCPKGHGQMEGRFCSQCGAELTATPPPAAGEGLRIRSPEAHVDFRPVIVGILKKKEAEI